MQILLLGSFILFFLPTDSLSQQWMKLALVSGDIYNRKFCNNYRFWTDTQRKLCINYGDLIPKVSVGARIAYDECIHQFRWRRWNCSAHAPNSLWTTDSKNYPSLFGNSLIMESKEAAFISALFSAGVVFSVTKACSSNLLQSCSCDVRDTKDDSRGYRWHRCNDNVNFGVTFSKQFIDSVELNWSLERMYSSHARSLMNLHNNDVGRKTIESNMKLKCACHGVSGACTSRICSREIPDFRFIGNVLKRKFDAAIKVKLKYISTRQVLMPAIKYSPPVTNTQLVYLKNSPLYCSSVTGRRCRQKKGQSGSCNAMCCGRGYRTKERSVVKNCNCQFIWCCRITCQKCTLKQKIYICK